jgi:hypothetical protein
MVEDVWGMLRGRGESKEKDKSQPRRWADTLSYKEIRWFTPYYAGK